MYDPETAHELLALGNNFARQAQPEALKEAELTVRLPQGWLVVLGRSDHNDFQGDGLKTDGFKGDFDQLQAVIPQVPVRERPSRDIIISTGKGVDPGQHPLRARLPKEMQSQLVKGDVTIMSVRADQADDVPEESRADEVFSVVDSLMNTLKQRAPQNPDQNNVQ